MTLFSLKHTLECGQLFRCDFIDDYYWVTVRDLILKLRQGGNDIEWESSYDIPDEFISYYFSLDHDLEEVYKGIDKDKIIHAAIEKFKGLRIMKQERWECLISYICSANTNIPNIRSMIEKMSRKYGKPISLGKYETYSFPEPEALAKANETELRECGVGFRAPYILNAAKNYEDIEWTREGLIALPGVGEKIADCVCLFALGELDRFPVDTWVNKCMAENYCEGSKEKQREYGREYFGKYAGYAQEYLFYYWRTL